MPDLMTSGDCRAAARRFREFAFRQADRMSRREFLRVADEYDRLAAAVEAERRAAGKD